LVAVCYFALMIAASIFVWSLIFTGNVYISAPTNIDGIPFPQPNNETLITENLAHSDIVIHQPVFAKQLNLTVDFIPRRTASLSVGIRQNQFWLSYQPVTFYKNETGRDITDPQTASITIDLTDKLAAADQSLDLMFFTDNNDPLKALDENNQTALWTLRNINAHIKTTQPTILPTIRFLRGILLRERAV
ncbi:MAG: hypothetical protein U1E51_07335, partial [Candidatus Binatia bacterium]|nr:hypothetical protein [Candidatus Binatia bacterium]